jgi:hypothetical protein
MTITEMKNLEILETRIWMDLSNLLILGEISIC